MKKILLRITAVLSFVVVVAVCGPMSHAVAGTITAASQVAPTSSVQPTATLVVAKARKERAEVKNILRRGN